MAAGYAHVADLLARKRCVVLDGGVATELQRLGPASGYDRDPWLRGAWALTHAPELVEEVHRRYLDAGADVVSTDTWSILAEPAAGRDPGLRGQPYHWLDAARRGVQLARAAVADAGREASCAVAFAVSEELVSPVRAESVRLLGRAFADDPPDLILLETLTLIREPATSETVELLLETGLPVWLSFRRCRHGVCGVYGEHWGPPEGDLFGRAARRFEEQGISALLVNCLPTDHVPGMLSWLHDFTDLPLGVYPNLGYLGGTEWRFDPRIGPEDYARLALGWREEGARIVGGCCGVTPEHIAAAKAALEGTKPGTRRVATTAALEAGDAAAAAPWLDDRSRNLFPLPFPELTVDPGVFVPTQGSYLLWKHLFTTGAGAGLACLDVGCGCGILAVQLGLNAAGRVHAIDIDRDAVANTLANAFRKGVADRVTGEAVDLFQWEPGERFDLVVASLYQMPVDPFEEPSGHRPLDYWGRSLLDHFLRLLPQLLSDEGRALMMQLSIVGQAETARRISAAGLEARVTDFGFFAFGPLFEANKPQIEQVEELSDAYHLRVADDDVMVAYLLEITRA